jgi:hypothetical protein
MLPYLLSHYQQNADVNLLGLSKAALYLGYSLYIYMFSSCKVSCNLIASALSYLMLLYGLVSCRNCIPVM